MRILARSLVDAADTFLHPGYGAAIPQPLGVTDGLPAFDRVSLKLDLAEAFRLQGETLAGDPAGGLGVSSGLLDGRGLLWAALCSVCVLGAVLLLRRPRRRGAAAAAALLGISSLGLVGWGPGPGRSPPAAPSATARYASPELATKALLHGVLHDALVVADAFLAKDGVSLEELRGLVALPTRDLTAGMRHALRHHTLDGWGRPFLLKRSGKSYQVESPGADGKTGTADDLRIYLTRHTPDRDPHVIDHATYTPHAFFLRRQKGEHLLFFHSVLNGFAWHDEWRARRLTGTVFFDLIGERALRGFRLHEGFEWVLLDGDAAEEKKRTRSDARAVAALKSIHAELSKGAKHAPLILLVP